MQKPEFPKLSRQTVDRLKKLADFLEHLKLPKKAKFNLRNWGEHVGKHAPTPTHCGTTACAIGWAALSGKFSKQGLRCRWVLAGNSSASNYYTLQIDDTDFLPELDDWEFWYGRTYWDWLFQVGSYKRGATAKDVAKRIRTVLKEQPKEQPNAPQG